MKKYKKQLVKEIGIGKNFEIEILNIINYKKNLV